MCYIQFVSIGKAAYIIVYKLIVVYALNSTGEKTLLDVNNFSDCRLISHQNDFVIR